MKRRDFMKTVGVAGVAMASGDLIADLLAQSPQGQVLQSKFKGLADIVLGKPSSKAAAMRTSGSR